MESITVVGRSPKVEVKAQLIIKDFLEEIVLCKPGQCRISDPFLVGDASMVIKVYPNGYKEKSKGHVSVILYNESDTEVCVRYQVTTLAKSTECQKVVPGNKGRGWDELLTHAEISPDEGRKPRCVKVWENLFTKMHLHIQGCPRRSLPSL